MSLPFYDLTCGGCDYTGRFSYSERLVYIGDLPKGFEPRIGLIWCHQCQAIKTAILEANRDELDQLEKLYEEKVAKERGIFGFKSKKRVEQRLQVEASLREEREHYEYWCERGVRTFCLTCGGKLVEGVTLPPGYRMDAQAGFESIGVRHACGGSMMAKVRGRLSYAGDRAPTYYDDNGIVSGPEARRERDTSAKRQGPARQSEPNDVAKTDQVLVNSLHAIDHAELLFGNLLVRSLGIENDLIEPKEVYFFALAIHRLFYYQHGSDEDLDNLPDFVAGMALHKLNQCNDDPESGVAQDSRIFQARYSTYRELFFAMVRDEENSTRNAAIMIDSLVSYATNGAAVVSPSAVLEVLDELSAEIGYQARSVKKIVLDMKHDPP